jgi:hypothetical protein
MSTSNEAGRKVGMRDAIQLDEREKSATVSHFECQGLRSTSASVMTGNTEPRDAKPHCRPSCRWQV